MAWMTFRSLSKTHTSAAGTTPACARYACFPKITAFCLCFMSSCGRLTPQGAPGPLLRAGQPGVKHSPQGARRPLLRPDQPWLASALPCAVGCGVARTYA